MENQTNDTLSGGDGNDEIEIRSGESLTLRHEGEATNPASRMRVVTERARKLMEPKIKLTVEQVARLCHMLNREYCMALGDFSQDSFEGAPQWQRDSAINGVKFHLSDLGMPPWISHTNWLDEKLSDGWTYGPVKDVEKKQHPCCLPYEELPVEQRVKDYILGHVVEVLARAGMIIGHENEVRGL